MPTDTPTLSFLGVLGFVLLWNVILAGQIAQARRQSPDVLALTALCGLLIAPGATIALSSTTVVTGRTVAWVTWLWPLTLFLFVLQSGLAVRRRLVTSLISVPVFACNTLLFLAASARYVSTLWPGLPDTWMAFNAAHTGALGVVWGPAALWSPLAVQLPLLAPAYPARWRLSKAIRAALAAGAAATALAIGLEYPTAVRALATFSGLTNDPLRARPRGDLALGVRILPELSGPPTELALTRDLGVADSLGARVLSVTIRPSGATALTLDSLNHSLAPLRRDSVILAITIGYDASDREAFAADPGGYRDKRLAAIDRTVRRLRPDVLLPALDPMGRGALALGQVPVSWWTDYLTRAGRLAHRLRPRTQVGVAASSYTTRDSVLYSWGTQSRDIDLMGFSFAPTFGGGGAMLARLRAADRWSANQRKPHWIFSVRSFPLVFGERAQDQALTGTFAWASGQPAIRAVIVDAAGDHDLLTGLQRADGRLRPAVASLAAANLALQEAAVALR